MVKVLYGLYLFVIPLGGFVLWAGMLYDTYRSYSYSSSYYQPDFVGDLLVPALGASVAIPIGVVLLVITTRMFFEATLNAFQMTALLRELRDQGKRR